MTRSRTSTTCLTKSGRSSKTRSLMKPPPQLRTLIGLGQLALEVGRSDTDKKWEELRGLLSEDPEMKDASGKRRKVIIFTEYKDTLNYLAERLRNNLGRDDAVVTIDGSTKRKDRKNR